MSINWRVSAAAHKGKQPGEVRALFKSAVHNTASWHLHESVLSLARILAFLRH